MDTFYGRLLQKVKLNQLRILRLIENGSFLFKKENPDDKRRSHNRKIISLEVRVLTERNLL